jgi:hypothetical protein
VRLAQGQSEGRWRPFQPTEAINLPLAALDNHFAADDQLPADAARWRELKRHLVPMKDALDLVQTTLREERERGMALTADTAHKLEGYARFGLGGE